MKCVQSVRRKVECEKEGGMWDRGRQGKIGEEDEGGKEECEIELYTRDVGKERWKELS